MMQRLQKILSQLGIASRRKAEEIIGEGRVTVNGKTAHVGMSADMDNDHIKVDGKLINKTTAEKVYIKFYKPLKVLSTMSQEDERETIANYFAGFKPRVYPVGRLDYNTEGLIFLTNDGDFANGLLHPSKKVPKTYHVKIKGEPVDYDLERLRQGIVLDDGPTLPASVRHMKETDTLNNTWVEITITEGRKRQVRRMFERIKHPVIKLKRVSIGGVKLGRLSVGEWGYLTEAEKKRLVIKQS